MQPGCILTVLIILGYHQKGQVQTILSVMLWCYLKMHISVYVQKLPSWSQWESSLENEEMEGELVGSDSNLSEFLHPHAGMHTKSESRS